MPRTEDGEFELVLGNKQLLSVFFIVVVLLGVFFAMGYIAGRNSAPGASEAAKRGDDGKPIAVDSSQRTSPMPETTQASHPAQTKAADADTSTQPVASSQPPPQEQTPAETAAPATAPPPPKPKPPKQAPPSETGDAARVADPIAGAAYLQVVATARPEAEVIAGTLSKRGYKTQLAAAPTAGTFRVLVGPLKDASEIASTKAALEQAGFKPIVRRF
ncbi:MAG: SPOR domain-containing protein [Bryobacteraceae bacterium]